MKEKRELKKFPSFTVNTFLDGTYFKSIDEWFSDTFPYRDLFINANALIKNIYGIKTVQFYGDFNNPENTPAEKKEVKSEIVKDYTDNIDSNKKSQTTDEEETGDGGADVDYVAETSTGIYISGNQAFGYFGFDKQTAEQYVEMINYITNKLENTATVYDVVVPTNIGIYLDDDTLKQINASNEKEAIDYVYNNISDKTVKIRTYNTLKKHNNEYIYFRTDHHWTALGAYYAYKKFAEGKRITPTPLSEYKTMTFDGFLGTFYSGSGNSPALVAEPDTVTAYVPKGTNDLQFTDTEGNVTKWNVVYDVSQWESGSKYGCFIAGDRPYTIINNPLIKDGSSCVVIKESYGNAFVPFLVDNYENVHVIDYRYYKGNLTDFVKTNNIKDVIFLNNIQGVCSSNLVECMKAITEN